MSVFEIEKILNGQLEKHGTIAAGVTSLFGGRARRREQKAANEEFAGEKAAYQDFSFSNPYAEVNAPQVDAVGYDASTRTANTLGPAAQAQAAAQAEAQGYTAAQAEAAQADQVNLGEATGRTNQFENLQVNTLEAEQQAQQSDQALAAQQDLARQSGTGAGGVTALAQAALQSKRGVAASIGQQEAQNAQLRAQGATSVQQENLGQRNLARQANIQQNQFNTGLEQNTRLTNTQAQNNALQFGAQASNAAALQHAGFRQATNIANVGAQNDFALRQFGAQEAADTQSLDALNRASEFGASQQNVAAQNNAANAFAAQQLQAQGAAGVQQQQYDHASNLYGLAADRKGAADQARAKATGDLVGGIIGGVGLAATGGVFGGADSAVTGIAKNAFGFNN